MELRASREPARLHQLPATSLQQPLLTPVHCWWTTTWWPVMQVGGRKEQVNDDEKHRKDKGLHASMPLATAKVSRRIGRKCITRPWCVPKYSNVHAHLATIFAWPAAASARTTMLQTANIRMTIHNAMPSTSGCLSRHVAATSGSVICHQYHKQQQQQRRRRRVAAAASDGRQHQTAGSSPVQTVLRQSPTVWRAEPLNWMPGQPQVVEVSSPRNNT